MDLQKVLEKRASIRKYSDKEVKMENVIEAIEAANCAPSPGNLQILKYVIVDTLDLKEKIAEYCQQDFIKSASVVVVVCSDSKDAKRFYDIRGEKYVKHHVGAAVENFLLKITDLGLAACWVGAFTEGLKNVLKVPDGIKVEVVIPIGYKAVGSSEKQKRKYSLQGRIFYRAYGNKFSRRFEKVRRGDL